MKWPRNGKLLQTRTLAMIMFLKKQGPELSIHHVSVCKVAPLHLARSLPTGRYDPGFQGPYHLSRPTKHTVEINRNQLST